MGAFDCDCIENLMGRFEEERKADRIQSCVDHINTAVDVDPWAKELVAEMGKEILKAQLSKEGTTSDCISRHDAIDALMEILDRPNHAEFLYTDEICKALNELPSVQPEERTEERTETHACDCISRQAAIDAVFALNTDCVSWLDAVIDMLDALPSAQHLYYKDAQSERETGRWLETNVFQRWKRSECGEATMDAVMGEPRANYCPNCGAKMKEGKQE